MAARVRQAPGYLASLPVGMYDLFIFVFVHLFTDEKNLYMNMFVLCSFLIEKHLTRIFFKISSYFIFLYVYNIMTVFGFYKKLFKFAIHVD